MKKKEKVFSVLGSAVLASSLLIPFTTNAMEISGPIASTSVLETQSHEQLYDARNVLSGVIPTSKQLLATNKLIDSIGSGTKVQWNKMFGTPSSIVKDKGYLTAPSSGSAETIARGWLKANAEVFGLAEKDIDSLKVIRNYKVPGTGLQPVTFQQSFDGIESIFGGRVIVAVNKSGQILSVTGNLSKAKSFVNDFALSEADALNKVISLEQPNLSYTAKAAGQANGWKVFDGNNVLPTKQYVKKAVFSKGDEMRPVYRVLYIEELQEGAEVIIDAKTGERLYERSLVQHLNPEGAIFENYPGSSKGGTMVNKSFKGDAAASPNGWLLPTSELGVTTLGNNANSFANWSNFLAPADQAVRPVNPLGQFKYPFLNAWQKSKGQALPPSYAEDVNSATTNLFYHHNLFHDYFYKLGWVEGAGNLQTTNFGKGGSEGDAIMGLVQAGAASGGEPTYTGRDNAYMLTLPDGLPAWSGMFLWEPIAGAFEGEYADGDYDAGIIYHEYSHALSTRLVAGGESLGSHQAGSMGEAWGDWFAMHYLIKNNLQDKAVVGAYVTGNEERGIRSWALEDSPLQYGDIGFDIIGPEVHADGEIWAAILWKVREDLLASLGKEAGEKVVEQLVIDAMPISAPNPSMVDMRDAIIAADTERYGGKHYDTLWAAFASRGLGFNAASNGGNDTDPTPAYNHPINDKNGLFAGKIINAATNKPVEDVRIIIGEYEARTSAVTKTAEKGAFGVPMLAGTYDITIQAKGFGSRTLKDVEIDTGKNKALKISLEPNVASSSNGAAVTSVSSESDSNQVKMAIDDTEASVYASEAQEGGFTGAEFVVDLATDKAVKVSSVNVSAFKDISKGRFATIKDFTVLSSIDGETWTEIVDSEFTASIPRPATPDLHYKEYELEKTVEAKYLKLVVKNAQNNAAGYIQVAELQAFGPGKTKISPLVLEPEEPFVATGTVTAGNAGTGIGNLADVGATLAVTENEFVTTQNPTPTTQGLDGYVVTLPSPYGDGIHTFNLTSSAESDYDYDVYFYNKNFEVIGSVATSGADETGVIPGGTAYVYVGLYSGANVPFTFTALSPY
ncbi:M36 family metallopeptidase [Planococcus halocryophilus]|uniref:M36 family metallopeptidase n=1 Tax=Planococcus halocryophilus TaxID=1215089 RepID=UPI001F109F65|nr:M36 family metallopeptidase [Planococcus halocryophilus]MCH4826340.1 M36 family metallopeptidase [Planococcus halocryophilus]